MGEFCNRGGEHLIVEGMCVKCGSGARPITRRKSRRPATSKQAWRDIQDKITELHGRILNAIRLAGGPLTDDELEVVLKLPHQNVSARTNELRNAGRLVASGVRKRTRQGRHAMAWALAEQGATVEQGTLV